MTPATRGPTIEGSHQPSGGRRRSSRRTGFGVLTLVALLIVLPPAARAANPSVDQYVESVPTADGDTIGGGNGGVGGGRTTRDHANPGPTRLPHSVRQRIRSQGGSDAATLETIASSPALGAPDSVPASDSGGGSGRGRSRSGGGGGGSGGNGNGNVADEKPPSAIKAATAAAVDGGGGSMGVLAGGLILLTAAGAGIALARRRRS
jgi:hypothetical protein